MIDVANYQSDEPANTESAEKRDFPPVFPATDTQPARLIALLLRNVSVDPLFGWKRLGIYRLSDTVLQLRKRGWPVETRRLDVQNRFNERCHVALYSLPNWAIDAAGERGREFARFEMEQMNRQRAGQ